LGGSIIKSTFRKKSYRLQTEQPEARHWQPCRGGSEPRIEASILGSPTADASAQPEWPAELQVEGARFRSLASSLSMNSCTTTGPQVHFSS
jgi:hypothetical protein